MAVFRKSIPRPVPAGARIITAPDGRRRAKWTPRGQSRQVVADVETAADGREVVRVETGCYYARWRDADGVVRVESTGCRDEANANAWLADRLRSTERVRAGLMTAREARASERRSEAVAEHLAAFVASIRGKRGGAPSPVHAGNVRRYLDRLATDCGWRILSDLTRESLDAWIRRERERSGRPRSAASVNRHVTAAIAFANWASDPTVGRLPSDPFVGTRKLREADDPRRQRRAFSNDELARLLDAARSAPAVRPRSGLNGRDVVQLSGSGRADVYLVLAATGLRVGELAGLRAADVRLDAVPPFLTIPAAVAKSRRAQTIPLRSDAVAIFATWTAGKPLADPVVRLPACLIRRFDADLKRAGIPKRASDGRTLDLHALRHTFGTSLAAAGVSPRTAMELMRHSDMRLTQNLYVDPRLLPTAAAVESTLPVRQQPEADAPTLRVV